MKSQQITALFLGLIFIVLAMYVRAEVPELPAGELVDQARVAASEDHHRESLDLYLHAIAEDSTRAAIVAYELARQYTWAEVTDSALYWFNLFLDANPGDKAVADFLDDALAKFDEIYAGERPGFLEGYEALKEAVTPWGT